MKKLPFLLLAIVLLFTLHHPFWSAFAQGTAFTYQGRLNTGANPANGSYDLTFALFDSPTNGLQLGATITNTATAISNGLFTVTLDFGNQFPGSARWLEISVRTNGNSALITLDPRQPLTSSPYAIQAANAASVAATNITGTLTPAQLPGAVVTNGMSGVNITGTFTGDGAGLTNLARDWTTNAAKAGAISNKYVGPVQVTGVLDVVGTNDAPAFTLTSVRSTVPMTLTVSNQMFNTSIGDLVPSMIWDFGTGTNDWVMRVGQDGNRFRMFLNSGHNFGHPGDDIRFSEMQETCSGAFAFGPGFGLTPDCHSHIQFGIGPGNPGTPSTFWSYGQSEMNVDAAHPLSVGWPFTSAAVGNGYSTKYPGFMGRWISTNAPNGVYELTLFSDLKPSFASTGESWEARADSGSQTITPVLRLQDGNTNLAIFAGALLGNGSFLTNLNASALASGTVPNAQLPATRFATNGFIPQIKTAFTTNYAVASSDCVLFCKGTNQVITLLNATNASTVPGKTFTIVAASTTGSVIVTNANGLQTILGTLSQRISSTNKLTLITDGSNWW